MMLIRGLTRGVCGTVIILDPLPPRASSPWGLWQVQLAGPDGFHVSPSLPVGGDCGRELGAIERLRPDQRGEQFGGAGGPEFGCLFGQPDEVAQAVVNSGGPFDARFTPVAAHAITTFQSVPQHNPEPIYIIRMRLHVGGMGTGCLTKAAWWAKGDV
jgi:hypothetical protein